MSAQKILLFSDRISHPARACLLTLQKSGLPYEEKNTELFKGAHLKTKELPFKKIPVLKDGDFTVAESTSILRYVALKSGVDSLYPSDIQKRVKVDECMDFWQSTFNPNVLKIVQNTLMFKMMFRMKSPDTKLIEDTKKLHTGNKKVFNSYFLAGKPFIAGDSPSIADVLMACSLEQSTVAGVDNSKEAEYLNRVKSEFGDYESLHEAVRGMPDRLKQMKML